MVGIRQLAGITPNRLIEPIGGYSRLCGLPGKQGKMAEQKKWVGDKPTKCDLCGGTIRRTFIDGKTRMGPWGIMCRSCHFVNGVGLGTGKGQRYLLDLSTESWVCVEGSTSPNEPGKSGT